MEIPRDTEVLLARVGLPVNRADTDVSQAVLRDLHNEDVVPEALGLLQVRSFFCYHCTQQLVLQTTVNNWRNFKICASLLYTHIM